MDVKRKLKIAWKDAFNGDAPEEIIGRLECENDSDVNCLLTGARNKTWELISELEQRLEQEKFMLNFLEGEIKDLNENSVENGAQNDPGGGDVDIDNMYAKVNKSSKSQQNESQVINDNHASESDQKSQAISQIDVSYEEIAYRPTESNHRDSYEEITFQPLQVPEPIKIRRESLGKTDHKKKVKGSVRDKIKRFEFSNSLDGDEKLPDNIDSVPKPVPDNKNSTKLTLENTNKLTPKATTPTENKLPVPPKPTSPKPPPPISPRPSPAVRKRQQRNDTYEEIDLPCFAANKTDKPGNTDMSRSANSLITNTNIDNKQEDSLKDKLSTQGCGALNQSTSAPSANLHSTEINDSNKSKVCDTANLDNEENFHYASLNDDNDDYAVLKDLTVNKEIEEKSKVTETVHDSADKTNSREKLKDSNVKPIYSENEPSFSTFKSGDVKVSVRGHFNVKPHEQRESDDDEGDYATLSDIPKIADRHKTLIEVKSGGSDKNDSGLDTAGADKVKTGSNLHIVSSTISRSTEDLSHYKDIDDDNIESITNEEEMKKLFSKKDGIDMTASFVDGTNSVIGKSIKSLSSSDSDEELNGENVPFKGDVSEPKVSKEPPKPSRATKKRVPDYEKWDFQALLTNPNVSAADPQNLAEDTDCDDDLSPSPYDNRLSPTIPRHVGHGHKTVEEQNSLSDDGLSNKETRMRKPGRYSPQLSPQMRKHSTMSTASDASRMSTACRYFLMF